MAVEGDFDACQAHVTRAIASEAAPTHQVSSERRFCEMAFGDDVRQLGGTDFSDKFMQQQAQRCPGR